MTAPFSDRPETDVRRLMILAQEYTDVAGDHPLNLGSTTQAFNAFCLTGEAKYAEHVVEYLLRVVIVMISELWLD
eukprot:SAG25_NODE_207_length_11874_cov_27.396773_10_plen_75_part_00